jgi:hypothetical protein
MVEILTLWSPHKLLKFLAVSPNTLNAAKVPQKNEILTVYPGYDGNGKKTHLMLLSLLTGKRETTVGLPYGIADPKYHCSVTKHETSLLKEFKS